VAGLWDQQPPQARWEPPLDAAAEEFAARNAPSVQLVGAWLLPFKILFLEPVTCPTSGKTLTFAEEASYPLNLQTPIFL